MILNALLAAIATTAAAATALADCYLLCRIALYRHRLAAWEPTWAATDRLLQEYAGRPNERRVRRGRSRS